MDLRLWISDQLGTFVKVTVCSRVSVFQTDRWPLFNRPCQAILLLGESSFMPEHNRTGGVDRHRPGDILKDGVWRWVPSSAWSLNTQLMNMFSSCIIRGRESVESEFLGAGRELGLVSVVSPCSCQLHTHLVTMAFLFVCLFCFVFQGCAFPHQANVLWTNRTSYHRSCHRLP